MVGIETEGVHCVQRRSDGSSVVSTSVDDVRKRGFAGIVATRRRPSRFGSASCATRNSAFISCFGGLLSVEFKKCLTLKSSLRVK